MGAEVFERCGGGAAGDVGERHEVRDGGQGAVAGGVVAGGRACPLTRRCGRGRARWLCSRRPVLYVGTFTGLFDRGGNGCRVGC